MGFVILCIINIGYNLILIFIYYTSGILSIFFDLNKSFFGDYNTDDDINDDSYDTIEDKEREFNLMKGIRRISSLIGIYICLMFLIQLIELFKFHYKAMKERELNHKKKYKYI